MAEETKVQVNIMMDGELAKKLDEMVTSDFSDRSKFIRRLIAGEWDMRHMPRSAKEYMEKQVGSGQ